MRMHPKHNKHMAVVYCLQDVFTTLTSVCDSSRLSKGTHACSWHPFFGWINADIDRRYLIHLLLHVFSTCCFTIFPCRNVEGLNLIQKQFQLLWNGPMVEMIVGTPLLRVSNSLTSKGTYIGCILFLTLTL